MLDQKIAAAIASVLLTLQVTATCLQVKKTYQLKNGDDLSYSMLLFQLIGVTFSLPYAFATNMELPYKIGFSCQTLGVTLLFILVSSYRKVIRVEMTALILASVFAAAYSMVPLIAFTEKWGIATSGWIMMIALGVRNIPQLIRTFQRKSVSGITIAAPLSETIAGGTHLALALHFGHGWPLIINHSRNCVMGIIRLAQYLHYTHSSK